MTQLEREIDRRGLTFYKVLLTMGLNPQSAQGSWSKRISGEPYTIEYEDLKKICNAVSSLSDEPLTVDQISVRPKRVYLA